MAPAYPPLSARGRWDPTRYTFDQMVKTVVLAGGTGQVGTILRRAFEADGCNVVVLSRGGADGTVRWDASTLGDWAERLEGADVVVNLAGRSVNCRYGRENRRAIMDSRVESTRVLGEAIARAARPPRVWLQSSTATIYAHRLDAPNDERTGILGGDEPDAPDTWRFSIDVAKSWERAAHEAITPHTRKVLLRSAIVLSPDRGGIFDTLLGLVRRGVGGPAAGGRQIVSWIHHHDFVRSVRWLIERDDVAGPVNLASPNPLPQREFFAALREAWGTRIGLPATRWMLELAAIAMRTETELILKSRYVVPGRLLEQGFAFEEPDWPAAARQLVADWRAGAAR
ncbi:MAG TPA: TIGR01777 family oxidoreductase [Solirubrobacteraceae bacterium]|nr:TIGR01777 family oxidoreductase [Solirubrobacteraceae bacterium]